MNRIVELDITYTVRKLVRVKVDEQDVDRLVEVVENGNRWFGNVEVLEANLESVQARDITAAAIQQQHYDEEFGG